MSFRTRISSSVICVLGKLELEILGIRWPKICKFDIKPELKLENYILNRIRGVFKLEILKLDETQIP